MNITITLYPTEVNEIIRDALLLKGFKVKGDIMYLSNPNGQLRKAELRAETFELVSETNVEETKDTKKSSPEYGRIP